jgi:hypothetical protein
MVLFDNCIVQDSARLFGHSQSALGGVLTFVLASQDGWLFNPARMINGHRILHY